MPDPMSPQQQFMDPFQQWRGLLQTTPAAQGLLSNFQAPTFGAQLPNRSTPLWFGGALPQGAAHGTAAPISPQQNSYWPQILALLQNPLQLPQAPGVQPVPSFPPQTPPGGGAPQLPPQVPITPGMIPPSTPGTPPGTGTTLPPGISTLPLPQPTPLPGQTLPPGGITTPIPTPVSTPAPAVAAVPKKSVTVKPKDQSKR